MPFVRARYPADWSAISRQARERAGWCCQWDGCTARQYDVGWWEMVDGVWRWHRALTHTFGRWKDAREAAAGWYYEQGEDGRPPTVIVLTVAHLNHDPQDCRPENLRAWCQRHHLAYDHDLHRANAQATRRARAGTLELF